MLDFSRQKKAPGIRVGVLRGGPSGEYEVSLKSGSSVLGNMPEKYHPIDIFIDKKGNWHWQGMETEPAKILKHVDVVFNGLHGEYGEDGKVQKLLEHFRVPYTGSNSLGSALAMNKVISKNLFEKAGLKIPEHKVLKKEKSNYLNTFEVFSFMPKPLVIKPVGSGSSLGVKIVKSLEEMTDAINEAFKFSPGVMVERHIKGREITCGVVEGFKTPLHTLPPIEIRPAKDSPFFDYNAKYSGKSEEICPAEITPEETRAVQNVALMAHKALNLRHYSRTDMILTDEGEIFILEINTLPGLTKESLLPKSLKASGTSLSEFVEHIITLALHKKY